MVARQWQSLTGAPVAMRALCRAQQTVAPRLAAPVRWYAANSKPVIRPLNSAILIPGSIPNTRKEDLINFMHPVPHATVAKDTFCVFFVTPAFAPWLLKESDFLAKAVRRVYSNAFNVEDDHITIHTLCAVVDKLPAGRALKEGITLKDEANDRRSNPPINETGYEGIAYVALPSSSSVPSVMAQHPEKGAIDFTFPVGVTPGGIIDMTWRMPLANTVFQTGSQYTMFLSRWLLTREKKSLTLEQSQAVSHHGINMKVSENPSTHCTTALGIPLLPLTQPRRVQGYMGNIVRTVFGEGQKVITASAELEEAVPLYFKARELSAQPTKAWALVMPHKIALSQSARTSTVLDRRIAKKEEPRRESLTPVLFERLWQSTDCTSSRLINKPLLEGARLHRVLSGGGGWGKKAGLLSLDPIPVNEEIPIRMEDASSAFDGPGDFSTALKPVVQENDGIQFFISPVVGEAQSENDVNGLAHLKSLPKEKASGWELGTIPSTVDTIPGGSWQHTSDSKYMGVFRHSFGALTEEGLTLTVRREAKPNTSDDLVDVTKIDVPFSRFWMQESNDTYTSNDDIVIRSGKSLNKPAEKSAKMSVKKFHAGNDAKPPLEPHEPTPTNYEKKKLDFQYVIVETKSQRSWQSLQEQYKRVEGSVGVRRDALDGLEGLPMNSQRDIMKRTRPQEVSQSSREPRAAQPDRVKENKQTKRQKNRKWDRRSEKERKDHKRELKLKELTNNVSSWLSGRG